MGDIAHVVRERDDRRVDARLAQAPRERGRGHVAQIRRRDDQVVARLVPRERERFGRRRDVRDARRMADVEVEKLLEDDLVQLAVLREDERVVQTGNQEDVVDSETGEVGESGGTHGKLEV